jgi:hypothetical protein
VLDHNRQGPNRLDIMVVQRRCCPKSCDKRVRYGFVGQGGAPTLQEDNKKTVADSLGSEQTLGRRLKKDATEKFVAVRRVAATAIVTAWKMGERRRLRLADIAITDVERKTQPSSKARLMMKYRDVEYTVVQGIARGLWK